MSADEDTELRDLIVQTLENKGVISKIKAELRASVFLALEEDGSFRDKIPLANKELSDFISTAEGKTTVSLIREFLEFFNLNFTLIVFGPEVNAEYLSREELITQCKVESANSECPVLVELLRQKKLDLFKSTHTSSVYIQPSHNHPVKQKNLDIDQHENSNASKNIYETNIEFGQKKAAYDPFFDEPLPSEHSSMSVFNVPQGSASTKKKDDLPVNNKTELTESVEQTSANYSRKLSDELKIKDKENASTVEAKTLERKDHSIFALKHDSGFSSLKDFPPLTSRSAVDTDWLINKSQKRILPSLKHESESKPMAKIEELSKGDDEYSVESERSSRSSLHSVEQSKIKSDISDVSEQSIEEDLDETSSVDDLLSSISVGEESTTDQTVSNVNLTGFDYLEKCHPTKNSSNNI